MERSKTIRWDDPIALADAGRKMSGMDFLTALLNGELPPPPIAVTMNFSPVSVEPGRVEFECHPDESHYNPIGVVHGGLVCTLLDTVLGCAAHTTLAAGFTYTSIDISINYLRPVLAASAPLRSVGTVTKPGRRVIFADATVTDARGSLVATAHSSLLVIPIEATTVP